MVLLGAGGITYHVGLLWRMLTLPHAPWHMRLLALLPPALPAVAWRYRLRAEVVVWVIFAVAYAALRIVVEKGILS